MAAARLFSYWVLHYSRAGPLEIQVCFAAKVKACVIGLGSEQGFPIVIGCGYTMGRPLQDPVSLVWVSVNHSKNVLMLIRSRRVTLILRPFSCNCRVAAGKAQMRPRIKSWSTSAVVLTLSDSGEELNN